MEQSTKTLTLVEFLRARLDEDERNARAMQWDRFEAFPLGADTWAIELLQPDGEGQIASSFERSVAEHIARHDPARVLREVEAKRELVDQHGITEDGTCRLCLYLRHPCITLRLLAMAYADHPDYRDEWRP